MYKFVSRGRRDRSTPVWEGEGGGGNKWSIVQRGLPGYTGFGRGEQVDMTSILSGEHNKRWP